MTSWAFSPDGRTLLVSADVGGTRRSSSSARTASPLPSPSTCRRHHVDRSRSARGSATDRTRSFGGVAPEAARGWSRSTRTDEMRRPRVDHDADVRGSVVTRRRWIEAFVPANTITARSLVAADGPAIAVMRPRTRMSGLRGGRTTRRASSSRRGSTTAITYGSSLDDGHRSRSTAAVAVALPMAAGTGGAEHLVQPIGIVSVDGGPVRSVGAAPRTAGLVAGRHELLHPGTTEGDGLGATCWPTR